MTRFTKADYEAMHSLGSQMANVCFNLGQEGKSDPVTLSPREREIMRDLDKQWHELITAIRQRQKGTGK